MHDQKRFVVKYLQWAGDIFHLCRLPVRDRLISGSFDNKNIHHIKQTYKMDKWYIERFIFVFLFGFLRLEECEEN